MKQKNLGLTDGAESTIPVASPSGRDVRIVELSHTDLDGSEVEPTIFVSQFRRYSMYDSSEGGRSIPKITFDGGRFATNKKDTIERLRKHPKFGIDFFENELPKHLVDTEKKRRETITTDRNHHQTVDM